MDSAWFHELKQFGFSEKEQTQLDDLSYDYSNARIPLTVGQARVKILMIIREHPDWTVSLISQRVWSTPNANQQTRD